MRFDSNRQEYRSFLLTKSNIKISAVSDTLLIVQCVGTNENQIRSTFVQRVLSQIHSDDAWQG